MERCVGEVNDLMESVEENCPLDCNSIILDLVSGLRGARQLLRFINLRVAEAIVGVC